MRKSTLGKLQACAAFAILNFVCSVSFVNAAEDLPPKLQAVLSGHKVPMDRLSIVVREVGADSALVSVNPQLPLNPASTIKLLTTWLALEELGPAWVWPTDVYATGPVEQGTLKGDLILKGYGDPWLVTERLWSLQRELRVLGIRRITGDLVIDNSYFAAEYGDPGAFDNEPLRVYNVFPDAMLINFQAVRLNFYPDPARDAVNVVAEPMPSNLVIENRLTMRNGGCAGYQNGIVLELEGGRQRNRLIVSGAYGRKCPEYSMMRSVLTAPDYAYGLFRSLWEESGGALDGELRVDRNAVAELPAGTKRTLRAESPPLSMLINFVNKYSNNVMARHLLLTLGAEAYKEPATLSKSRQAVAAALKRRDMNFPELRLDNGSGLSRKTRISAESMATVLLRALESPWAPEYVSSLSLAGLDGTMRKRFRSENATGRMHLKTGRLNDVFATAGYVHARSGREFVVVIMQNFEGADRRSGGRGAGSVTQVGA